VLKLWRYQNIIMSWYPVALDCFTQVWGDHLLCMLGHQRPQLF